MHIDILLRNSMISLAQFYSSAHALPRLSSLVFSLSLMAQSTIWNQRPATTGRMWSCDGKAHNLATPLVACFGCLDARARASHGRWHSHSCRPTTRPGHNCGLGSVASMVRTTPVFKGRQEGRFLSQRILLSDIPRLENTNPARDFAQSPSFPIH